MSRFTTRRLVCIGRRRFAREQRRQWRIWSAAIGLSAPAAGYVLAPLDPGAVWGAAAGASMISGMCFVLSFIGPQALWRVSERGIAHATTALPRRRIRLDWNEVEQLRFDDQGIGVRGGGKEILMQRAMFEKDDWNFARDLVGTCLGNAFDLDSPTPWDIECERWRRLSVAGHVMHWCGIVALAVGIFASIVAGGFALLHIAPRCAFHGSMGIVFAWLGFLAWVTWRQERSRWRRR